MKRSLSKLSLLLMAFVLAVPVMTACGNSADTVITGTVYTADDEDSIVEAIAVKDDEIIFAGDKADVKDLIGNDTEVIETGDGMAMPSFVEAHAHGHEGGVATLFEVDMYACQSLKEYQDVVKKFIKEHPEQDFIRGTGWINGYIPSSGNYAKYLDEVTGDIPVALISADHHSYWVNSAAMEKAGIDKNTKIPEGGVITKDDDGNPTGIFREKAKSLIEKVIPDYTVEEFKEGILYYQNEVASYGITSYFDPMVNMKKNLLEAYQELEKEDKLLLQVYAGWEIDQTSNGGDYLGALNEMEQKMKENQGGKFEINGIKVLVDGVVEGHTAFLLEDYADEPGSKGESLWTQDALDELVAAADAKGITVHTHAIGDAAVQMTVNAIQKAKKANPDSAVRHAITHLQIVDPEDAQKFDELGIIAVTNPYWFYKEPGYYEELEVPYLGKERAASEYPMKSFFDAGAVVSVASDYPVTVPSMPLEAIRAGVTRCNPSADTSTLLGKDQKVTVLQMMKAATYNGAYQNYAEDRSGSLEVGKQADIILLDNNIMECDPFKIGSTKVLKTFLAGDIIFEKNK